jgi:hypothetical protein
MSAFNGINSALNTDYKEEATVINNNSLQINKIRNEKE